MPNDARAAARTLQRWSRAGAPPWLHGEVARRMAERLPVIRRTPSVVIDWWGHAGGSADALAAAYPKARRIVVEPSAALAARSAEAAQAPWWSARRWTAPAVEVCTPDALPVGAAELLWSNMALHHAADAPAMIDAWQRALAVDGFLMFSTLGPDTLRSLRELYAELGWGSPGLALTDMHDIGDHLVQAGFADPVMDQEQLTLTWADAPALLAELRTLGGNTDPARHAGLRSPRWRQRLEAALARLAGPDGRLRLGFEIVYGHAFKPAPRAALQPRTEVSLDAMRAMVKAGRTPRG